jgi:cytidine deaminase
MVDNQLLRLKDILIDKRNAQIISSGFISFTNSNHMCAILKDGVPISYGTNIYATNGYVTEHAEAQALRRLVERMGRRNNKKIKIDILVVRTNGSNSKPCNRCINQMSDLTSRFNIRNIYYTHQEEESGIRCVKFSKLINEDRHVCAYDRNIIRRYHGNPSHSSTTCV